MWMERSTENMLMECLANQLLHAYLAISLRGAAATMLTNLPPGQQQDYTTLTSALQAQFGTGHQMELNWMKMKAWFHWREESLPELAEDIEWLVRLTYPNAVESMVEVLTKHPFVDSLPEEDMRFAQRQNRPATLRAALETALELESYQSASRKSDLYEKCSWRSNQLRNNKEECAKSKESNLNADVLQQLVEELTHCCPELVRSMLYKFRRERTQGSWSNLICWKCE